MACTLILPYERLVLDITQIVGVAVFHLEHVGELVELLLRNLLLVDDNGIVEVAALYEVGLE